MTRLEGRLFLLYVALLPFFQPIFVRLRGDGPMVIVADLVFVMTAAAWLVSLATGRATLKPSRFYLFGGLYLGALTLSVVVSIDPVSSLVKLPGVLYLVAIPVLTINLVRSWDDVKRVLQVWAAAAAVVGLTGTTGAVLFYAGWNTETTNFALEQFGSLPPGNYPRLQATFANANALCTYMTVSLLVVPLIGALGWIRAAWARAIEAAGWVTALLSLSPGIGGLVLARAWWVWKRRDESGTPRAAGLLALAAGTVAAVAFFIAVLVDPAALAGSGGSGAPGEIGPSPRVLLWQRSVDAIAARPLLGRGVGVNPEPMSYQAASGSLQRLSDPHNVWLSVTVQAGIAGLAAFIALVVFVWRRTRALPGDDRPTALSKVALRAAFAGVLFYQGLSGSFEDQRHLWVLMGLMMCAGDERERLA